MSDRMSKFLIVVLLTVLIWTWAYLSQEQVEPLSGSLEVAPSLNDSLLVTFTLPNSDFSLTKVPLGTLNFKGPPSAISDLLKKYNLPQDNPDREKLNFFYAPPPGQPAGTYRLDLLDFLQKNSKTHELALSLESCNPEYVEVHIESLDKKKLPVQPLDENGLPLKGVTLEPPFVTMYARPSNQAANITLTPQDISAARKNPISIVPYVDLGIAGIVRFADDPIRVSLLEEDLRKPQVFVPTSIGYIMSSKLAGKYTVKLENESQLIATTQFYATDEAMEAYKKMRYHILIEIRDDDARLTEIPPRPVIYNFPRKYFKNGDIDIVEVNPPNTAKIVLEPVNSTPAP